VRIVLETLGGQRRVKVTVWKVKLVAVTHNVDARAIHQVDAHIFSGAWEEAADRAVHVV
jgi:hypothetical protein